MAETKQQTRARLKREKEFFARATAPFTAIPRAAATNVKRGVKAVKAVQKVAAGAGRASFIGEEAMRNSLGAPRRVNEKVANKMRGGVQKAGSFLGQSWQDLKDFYGGERLRDIPGKLSEAAMGLVSPDVRKKWQGASDAIIGGGREAFAAGQQAVKGGINAIGEKVAAAPAMPTPLGSDVPASAKFVPPGPRTVDANAEIAAGRVAGPGMGARGTATPRFVPGGGGSYAGNMLSAAQREFQRKRGLYAGPESSFEMEQRAIGGVNALTVSDRNRKAMAQKQLVRDYQGMANEAQTMREQLAGQKDIASIAGGVEQTKNMIEFAKTQVAVIVQRMKQGENIPPQVQASIEALKANPLMPEAEAAKHYQNIASFSQSPQGGQGEQGGQGGGVDANQNGVEDKDEEAMRNAKDPEWSKANPIKAQAIITYNKKKYPQIYGK